jgi:hypothetical protein
MKKIIISAFGLIAAGSVALDRMSILPSGMSILISVFCAFACFITISMLNHANGLKKKIATVPAKKEIITAEKAPALSMDVTKELARKSAPSRSGIFAS